MTPANKLNKATVGSPCCLSYGRRPDSISWFSARLPNTSGISRCTHASYSCLPRPFLASANPLSPHRSLNVLMIWAIASLGTDLTALLLDDLDDLRVARTVLLGARSVFLAALAIGYTSCFLRGNPQKKRDFVYGTGFCGFLLWLCIRLGPSPPEGEFDAFLWLGTINSSGLLTVLAGIISAESDMRYLRRSLRLRRPFHPTRHTTQPPDLSYVQPMPASEIVIRSWLAWDSTNSSSGESKNDPMAHVGEACSGDQKASDGDQPDDPLLPTLARRNSTDCAMDTPEETLIWGVIY